MKSLAIWVAKPYDQNELFNPKSLLNRDDCLAGFRLLRDKLIEKGGDCNTHDVFLTRGVKPDIVLFLDIPSQPVRKLLGAWDGQVEKWVILQECEVVLPRNWIIANHSQFDKIFTWNDHFVDNQKYFKLNFCNSIPSHISFDLSKKEKLCTLIAGNKKAYHPLELYSKRVEAIRWFERNHPEDFDLYGVGWDKYRFNGIKPLRALNKVKFLTKILAPHFPSYKGAIESKRPILEKYKFAICYENAQDIPGYITEKIFDCFFAGCVPIYWGAPDVTDFIPENTFIDWRKSKSYEELYNFLSGISESDYISYIKNIKNYIESKNIYPFHIENFMEILSNHF